MHPVDLFNAREVIDSLIEERDAYSATSMEMERENWRLTAEVANLKHDTERHIAIASSEADARVKAEAELAALREAVDKAPHAPDCHWVIAKVLPSMVCSCWKRDALRKPA